MQTTEKTKTSPSLDDSIQYIKGVGPKRALLLHKLGLETVEHCLYFIPHRYEDRSRVKKIGALVEGEQITTVEDLVLFVASCPPQPGP